MCLTRMEELESCLSGLLSTLKKNREHVPLEVLKTQYKQPYDCLLYTSRTAKMGKPQARDSHFSYNSSSSFRTASFSRLNSVQRATLVHTSGSTRVSSISLSLFSSSSILASVFFSSFSSFRLRACSSFCCCQESLLSELSVSGALVSAGSDGAGAYFSVSSSFFSR